MRSGKTAKKSESHISSFTRPVLLTQNIKRICQVHLIIKSFGRVLFVVKLEGFLKVKSVEVWMKIEQKILNY